MCNLTIAERVIGRLDATEDEKQDLIALSRYSVYEAEIRKLMEEGVIEEAAHEKVIGEYLEEMRS